MINPPTSPWCAAGPSRAGTVTAHAESVARAVAWMQGHVERRAVTLEEIARVAHLSKFHLVRVFERVTGATPRYFLACIRMQRAKELLARTQCSVTDVCLRSGYDSLGTFSATFRRLVGLTPSQFRDAVTDNAATPPLPTLFSRLAAAAHIPPAGAMIRGVIDDGQPKGARVGRGKALPSVPWVTFIGAYAKGAPAGTPFSGTVVMHNVSLASDDTGRNESAGVASFRIARPPTRKFHLLGVRVRFDLPPLSLALGDDDLRVCRTTIRPRGLTSADADVTVQLRPPDVTDPPLVVYLPALMTAALDMNSRASAAVSPR